MKTSLSILFVLTFSFIASFSCLAQEAKTEGQKAATPSIAPAVETGKKESVSSKKASQQFIVRVKTKKKVDFSGTVAHVDPETATLSIRNKGKTISFDMSNPILMGYQSTREIKRGDAVSVGYTQFGLQIRKGVFSLTHSETTPRAESITKPKKTTAKPGKNTPVRMKEMKNPTSFQDIDNNKDGKITPIELCVMIPGLTIQQFKEYDKNGDGCLNESEFMAIKRSR
ncbi:MAG: hypothetical protein C0399_12550 [Syntrophus sp. (in: bacteria)]|nr:hypothetical protein [Syntrophus sp. (in: bacteria)]